MKTSLFVSLRANNALMKKTLLRENCPNTKIFLVRIFLYSVQIQENTGLKKLRNWTLFHSVHSSKQGTLPFIFQRNINLSNDENN